MWRHHGTMDLRPYIAELHRHLEAAAEAGGDDARALAQRLAAPLDAALRLCLLEALAAAAQEITCELAPASVELRLRGREPEFVVTTPPEAAGDEAEFRADPADDWSAGGAFSTDERGMTRINLRLPEQLKARVDRAAAAEGLSVNAWLVRSAAAGVQRGDPALRRERRGPQGPQRFTGWAR